MSNNQTALQIANRVVTKMIGDCNSKDNCSEHRECCNSHNPKKHYYRSPYLSNCEYFKDLVSAAREAIIEYRKPNMQEVGKVLAFLGEALSSVENKAKYQCVSLARDITLSWPEVKVNKKFTSSSTLSLDDLILKAAFYISEYAIDEVWQAEQALAYMDDWLKRMSPTPGPLAA